MVDARGQEKIFWGVICSPLIFVELVDGFHSLVKDGISQMWDSLSFKASSSGIINNINPFKYIMPVSSNESGWFKTCQASGGAVMGLYSLSRSCNLVSATPFDDKRSMTTLVVHPWAVRLCPERPPDLSLGRFHSQHLRYCRYIRYLVDKELITLVGRCLRSANRN